MKGNVGIKTNLLEPWANAFETPLGHTAFFPSGWSGLGPLLFSEPLELVVAHNPAEIPALLSRLDQARSDGHWIAGWLAYDALGAYGAEPAFYQSPCGVFGVYDAPRSALDAEKFFERLGTYSLAEDLSPQENDEAFGDAVTKIRAALQRGDCYQVNHTEETRFHFQGDVRTLFRRLHALQPGSYSALIVDPWRSIVSLSPELFFNAHWTAGGALVETRPVKGTTPRRADPAADAQQRSMLSTDAKLRAENLMIVDLLRNDLGRHAIPGTVEVPSLFEVDTLPSLHHSYSTVRARFDRPTSDRFFEIVLTAIFPGGSITGAPKDAAMKLIATLEKRPRGVYTGMIGFGGPDSAAFNIAIRTLEIDREGLARFGSGCGVVWDSEAAAEHEESRLKRSFVYAACDDFRLVESIRLQTGRLTLLRGHLRRMRTAARYFSIPWNVSVVISALRLLSREPAAYGARKVRLTLDQSGHADAVVAGAVAARRAVTLCVADDRVFSGDTYRRFKTSQRQLYDREFDRAKSSALADDVMFLNETGEVVETSIANVVVRTADGRLITPLESTGALPGTLLGALEARHPGRIRRESFPLGAVLNARAMWTVNSVRGIMRVAHVVDSSGRVLREFSLKGAGSRPSSMGFEPAVAR